MIDIFGRDIIEEVVLLAIRCRRRIPEEIEKRRIGVRRSQKKN